MTFEEGYAIAKKYGLENEYEEYYEATMYDDPVISEDAAVLMALQEWDLL